MEANARTVRGFPRGERAHFRDLLVEIAERRPAETEDADIEARAPELTRL